MKKAVFFPILSLLVLVVITVLAVSVTHYFTADAIAAAETRALTQSIEAVLPGAIPGEGVAADGEVAMTYYDCADAAGDPLGRAYRVTAAGYGGTLVVLVGIRTDGSIGGVRILESSETPGMGKKAEDPAFYTQYDGQSGTLTVIRSGAAADGQISAIAGATITSKAVTGAVNSATAHFNADTARGVTQ